MCEVMQRAINKGIVIGEARGEARGRALGEAHGKALGEASGRALGEASGKIPSAEAKAREISQSLYKMELNVEDIARGVDCTVDTVKG